MEENDLKDEYKVILGDFHLGDGAYLENGSVNPLESFTKDQKFAEFLNTYNADKLDASEIELVVNGDFLDLLQVLLPSGPSERIETQYAIHQLKAIKNGHQVVFTALKDWLKNPKHKFRYIVGNHDLAMALKEVMLEFFNKHLDIEASKDQLDSPFRYLVDNLHIEHGQQGEVLWTVDENVSKSIDAPWGFYWVTQLLNPVKRECPYLDVVKPVPGWIWRTLLDKPIWLAKLGLKIAWFVIHNTFFNKNMSIRSKFKPTYSILKTAIAQQGSLAERARTILEQEDKTIVILAHNHHATYQRYPVKGEYFNVGTWCNIVSLYTESLGSRHQLNYVLLRRTKGEKLWQGQLRRWYGTPVIDELVLPR